MAGDSGLQVRDALPAELPAVRALTRRVYGEYATIMAPMAWEGLHAAVEAALASSEPAERIVALRDGVMLGSVMLFSPSADAYAGAVARAPFPEVRLLVVDPAARGQGVGRTLMDECVRRARAGGAEALGLHTSESMRAAIAMYREMGFVRDPTYDFHPPGMELVQAFRLTIAR